MTGPQWRSATTLHFLSCPECGAITGFYASGQPSVINHDQHSRWHARVREALGQPAGDAGDDGAGPA